MIFYLENSIELCLRTMNKQIYLWLKRPPLRCQRLRYVDFCSSPSFLKPIFYRIWKLLYILKFHSTSFYEKHDFLGLYKVSNCISDYLMYLHLYDGPEGVRGHSLSLDALKDWFCLPYFFLRNNLLKTCELSISSLRVFQNRHHQALQTCLQRFSLFSWYDHNSKGHLINQI